MYLPYQSVVPGGQFSMYTTFIVQPLPSCVLQKDTYADGPFNVLNVTLWSLFQLCEYLHEQGKLARFALLWLCLLLS